MKILHLASFLQGGAGRVIVALAREQQRAGHDVTVVTSRHGASGYGNYQAYLDELSANGLTPYLVDCMFQRDHGRNLAAVAAVDRIFPSGHEPDVIHTHAAIPSLVALLLAGARRAPIGLVQTMHGWGKAKTAEQVATDVSLLGLVDRVVAPSAESAGLLGGLGVPSSRIDVVPYGVTSSVPAIDEADHDTWIAMRRARHAGRLIVACVGTFGTRKNQALLVDAGARLPAADVLCVLIGDGDCAPLRQSVARHGCADRVILHGYSRAARALAAGADLLVLPSRSEGQPIAVIEAFCDGLLVAVSDIPELAELVENGTTGLTFPAEDPDALARTIAGVARSSNVSRRAMREAARARYAAQFTLTRMAERYAAVYESVRVSRTFGSRQTASPAA
jgi:glycosyltransferase involved in cell wall biosynthesis